MAFDLSTSKWGHWLPVLGASFLPIFILHDENFHHFHPSVLNLGSDTGQTDRQTDRQTDNGHQCLMSPEYGDGWQNKELTYIKSTNCQQESNVGNFGSFLKAFKHRLQKPTTAAHLKMSTLSMTLTGASCDNAAVTSDTAAPSRLSPLSTAKNSLQNTSEHQPISQPQNARINI